MIIQDIRPPVDVRPLIEHRTGSDCPACRKVDHEARAEKRIYAKVKQIWQQQDALAHCTHPQTRQILMRHVVDGPRGEALELEEMEQCIGCGRVLTEGQR